MRLVILEDEPTADVTAAEQRNRGKLAFSNGEILGKSFVKFKTSFGGAEVTPIPNSDLDKWFIDEELARPTNNGHVFFVHSKFLLIDPLSDDPLVCSGSANFSKNSLVANDENMLLIRGNTRIADIYMTEFDRIFRHFRARDIINQEAEHGHHKNPLLLDTTETWIGPNFQNGTYKNNRRLLFFPTGAQKPWSQAATKDPDAFADEDQRAKAKPRTAPKSAVKKATAKTKPPVKKAAKKKSTKPKPTAKKKSAKPKPTTKAKKAAAKKRAVKKTKAKRKR
jgi:hypothetical protein